MSLRTKLVVLGVLLFGPGIGCGEEAEAPEDLQTSGGALVTGPLGECSNITPDQVCVCPWAQWSSSPAAPCTMLNPTRRFYTNLTSFNGGYLNDNLHSFVVGPNVRMKACADDTFRGTCDYVTGVGGFANLDAAQSAGEFKLNGHQITAIYVGLKSEDCMNPGPFQVALFKDDDYNNLSDCTIISAPWSSGALFPNASFNADANGWNGGFGLPHDSLSSIIVGSSVRVELYKESNYGGGPPLKLAPGSRIPRLAAYGFNEIISSIKLNP